MFNCIYTFYCVKLRKITQRRNSVFSYNNHQVNRLIYQVQRCIEPFTILTIMYKNVLTTKFLSLSFWITSIRGMYKNCCQVNHNTVIYLYIEYSSLRQTISNGCGNVLQPVGRVQKNARGEQCIYYSKLFFCSKYHRHVCVYTIHV